MVCFVNGREACGLRNILCTCAILIWDFSRLGRKASRSWISGMFQMFDLVFVLERQDVLTAFLAF